MVHGPRWAEISSRKGKRKKKRNSEEEERRNREGKNNDCTLSFYFDFFGDSLKKKEKTGWGERSILAVTFFKNPSISFLTLAANRNLIKNGYILKANN